MQTRGARVKNPKIFVDLILVWSLSILGTHQPQVGDRCLGDVEAYPEQLQEHLNDKRFTTLDNFLKFHVLNNFDFDLFT